MFKQNFFQIRHFLTLNYNLPQWEGHSLRRAVARPVGVPLSVGEKTLILHRPDGEAAAPIAVVLRVDSSTVEVQEPSAAG